MESAGRKRLFSSTILGGVLGPSSSIFKSPEAPSRGAMNVSVWQRLVNLCWSDVVFPVSAPVPSNSQPKKQTHSLQWVLLGFGDFPISEVGVAGSVPEKINFERAWNGPGIPLHGF